jgi:hypothetical protein
MRPSKIAVFVLAVIVCATFQARAQVTNLPPTEFQCFLQQTNTIIIRGFTSIGSVSLGNTTLFVHAQEGNDVTHGQKEYAVTVGPGEPEQDGRRPAFSLVLDYDELDSLAGAIDYLDKVTSDVTRLNGFEATYVTKSGFRIISHSERKQGTVNTYIQFNDYPRIPASADQLNQIRSLIIQAKTTLDGIK